MIQEHIETFQISVKNWLLVCVQIVYTLRNVESKLLSIFPGHFDVAIMKQAPEGAPRAILENDAEVGCLGARSQEQHDVGMPDDLHDGALILELLQLVLLDDFFLDLLDGHRGVLPPTPVDNAVASLGQLSVVLYLVKWDLIVLIEDPVFIHHVHEALVLIHDASPDLFLDVLAIGTRLLKLAQHLLLFLREHTNGLLLFFSEAIFQVFALIFLFLSFLRFPTWFHDQFLTQALDLRFELFHLFNMWAVIILVLNDGNLLIILVLLLLVFTL